MRGERLAGDSSLKTPSQRDFLQDFSHYWNIRSSGFFKRRIGLFSPVSLFFDSLNKHPHSVCSGPGNSSWFRVWFYLLWSWYSSQKDELKQEQRQNLYFLGVTKLWVCLSAWPMGCLVIWLIDGLVGWFGVIKGFNMLPQLASPPGLEWSSTPAHWATGTLSVLTWLSRKCYIRLPW